ncbi:hypothetical protein ACFO0P_21660, partial [Deinococcus sonorensis]
KTQYHGKWYDLPLEPDKEAAFATADGAIRNFTLRLAGETPGGGHYGGYVYTYYSEHGGSYDPDRVEYTLTPDGPLLDGSTGQTIKAFDGSDALHDVPVGQYVVTARYLPTDGLAQPMLLAQSGEEYSPSTTILFREAVEHRNFADFSVSLVPKP